MIICITGTYGNTSLAHRILYNHFSIIHKPTILTTIYTENGYTVADIPPDQPPIKCDILILTCQHQKDVAHIARKWIGYHKTIIVALVNTHKEVPILCPAEFLVSVDNMANEGIHTILRLIHINKTNTL